MNTNKRFSMAWTGVAAGLAALTTVTTLLVRIPIPATTGYFNIGDIFILLAGVWLGPLAGFLVGACGSVVADAIGYPQFMLATFVTKGCEGLVAGLIGFSDARGTARRFVAVLAGALVMVVGYFIFEAYIYPALGVHMPFFNITTIQQAMIEAPINLIQGVIGATAAFGLWKSVSGTKLSSPRTQ